MLRGVWEGEEGGGWELWEWEEEEEDGRVGGGG